MKNSAELAQWIESIATTIAVIIALIIAIFQDRMRAWAMRPKLDVSIDTKPPDCIKIQFASYDSTTGKQLVVGDNFYLRMRVINRGNEAAKSVDVFAAKLLKLHADGSFKEVTTFMPMNLLWSGSRKPDLPALKPSMYRYCDLAHIIRPEHRNKFIAEDKRFPGVTDEKTILSFDTEVKPHTMSHLAPPGKHQLVVFLSAANAKPVEKTLEINLTGVWYDQEEKMFADGVGVKVL